MDKVTVISISQSNKPVSDKSGQLSDGGVRQHHKQLSKGHASTPVRQGELGTNAGSGQRPLSMTYSGAHSNKPSLFEQQVTAGFPSPADDFLKAETQLDLNEHLVKHPAATFFVRVRGDSMTGCGIYPDDILIVDRSLEATHRKVVIAVVNGELTVKRLHKSGGKVMLLPENDRYQPIVIEDEMQLEIWGVVTSVIHTV